MTYQGVIPSLEKIAALAKALPQPFKVVDVAKQVMKENPEIALSYQEICRHLGPRMSGLASKGKLYKVVINKRNVAYSFDKADEKLSLNRAAKPSYAPTTGIRIDIEFPPLAVEMKILVKGVRFTVIKE